VQGSCADGQRDYPFGLAAALLHRILFVR